jgi:hypothetical protein
MSQELEHGPSLPGTPIRRGSDTRPASPRVAESPARMTRVLALLAGVCRCGRSAAAPGDLRPHAPGEPGGPAAGRPAPWQATA